MRFAIKYLKPDTIYPPCAVARAIWFKNKVVTLVDRMLELHKKKNALPPSAEREKIEREITITDEKIDEIVYELYGVTEAERKIIEGQ